MLTVKRGPRSASYPDRPSYPGSALAEALALSSALAFAWSIGAEAGTGTAADVKLVVALFS